MSNRYCTHCKTTLNLAPSPYAKTKKYSYYMCKSCNTERIKKYRTTEKGRKAIYSAVKRYEARNPERRKAWVIAAKQEMKPCEICLRVDNIHRHHPNINKPAVIVFLCAFHHKEAHRTLL